MLNQLKSHQLLILDPFFPWLSKQLWRHKNSQSWFSKDSQRQQYLRLFTSCTDISRWIFTIRSTLIMEISFVSARGISLQTANRSDKNIHLSRVVAVTYQLISIHQSNPSVSFQFPFSSSSLKWNRMIAYFHSFNFVLPLISLRYGDSNSGRNNKKKIYKCSEVVEAV